MADDPSFVAEDSSAIPVLEVAKGESRRNDSGGYDGTADGGRRSDEHRAY